MSGKLKPLSRRPHPAAMGGFELPASADTVRADPDFVLTD
jgi:hypothetical protein